MADRKQGAGLSSGSSAAVDKAHTPSIYGETTATPSCTAWQHLPYVPSFLTCENPLALNVCSNLYTGWHYLLEFNSSHCFGLTFTLWSPSFFQPASQEISNFHEQTIQTHLNKCNNLSLGTDQQLSTYLYSLKLWLMIDLNTGSNVELRI